MCYSTTTGTVRKPMSFPGVVKPSPWPGLPQSHSSMAGPLWHHHHSTQASASDISEKISATTHLTVLPQGRQSPGPVAVPNRTRDAESPVSKAAPSVAPSPVSQSRSFILDESLPKPTPVSNEPAVESAATPTVAKSVGESSADLQPLSPTSTEEAARKMKRVRRRRCGTCTGCTRKENCGTCCVCTNPNATNSVCKLKRCELLKRRVSLFLCFY